MTPYHLFFKLLLLPFFIIYNSTIKREYDIKFIGVILDENLTWRKHINIIENKILKNLGLLLQSKISTVPKMLEKYLLFFRSQLHKLR